MIKLNLQLGLATVLTTALLAGCGGGGGSSESPPQASVNTELSAERVFALSLIHI